MLQNGTCHLYFMIFPDGSKLKIIDFGVSLKLKKSKPFFVGEQGQANFRSPEMLRGERYSYPTDMWAVGVVMYLCLAGKHPFLGQDQDVAENIKNKEIVGSDPALAKTS